MKKRVFVGMSGGVDSAGAALLLQQAGYDVTGVTMCLQPDQPAEGDDLRSARETAAALGIPHRVLDLRQRFAREVMDRFAAEYAAGRTPNPCVDCNREIKFGAMLDWALEQGADYIATGHYAQVRFDPAGGRWQLLRGQDRAKDQTYFLYQLTQRQLSHLLLPVGDRDKAAVRALLEQRGIPCAHRPDSQDICFIPGGDYTAFLRCRGVTGAPGDFVDQTGRVLGRHKGQECYTIGQRKGLGVSAGAPVYVLRKDLSRNAVVLGPNEALFSMELTAERVNLISVERLTEAMAVTARTRHSQREDAAMLYPLTDGRVRVVFDRPQRAITPGQAVVFYDGDTVVGGGTIC
ncbi:tRNA 2-thiouridine(34) synthase MnmA [Dysosmobacter sp.]|uniref:tRNA 2-thiouridine(34) synthase MnmA n=1 Tax=Dysosmobacter sp. TaxID=2591382 RepID=UPI002A87D95A|nr:tRNA 2-thiouridine(34) synthase MnmA [Dysosmobacter sp.]MDY3281220.1 tRNA 2-thiouridine(34) synthase MnmA [Dysosmobacter sp.]